MSSITSSLIPSRAVAEDMESCRPQETYLDSSTANFSIKPELLEFTSVNTQKAAMPAERKPYQQANNLYGAAQKFVKSHFRLQPDTPTKYGSPDTTEAARVPINKPAHTRIERDVPSLEDDMWGMSDYSDTEIGEEDQLAWTSEDQFTAEGSERDMDHDVGSPGDGTKSLTEEFQLIGLETGNPNTNKPQNGTYTFEEATALFGTPDTIINVAPRIMRVNQHIKHGEIWNEATAVRRVVTPRNRLTNYNTNIALVTNNDVRYRPSPENPSTYRSIVVTNLPRDMKISNVLAIVRGGTVVSAILGNTFSINGSKTALIEFAAAASAKNFCETFKGSRAAQNRHFAGICTTWIQTPTMPPSVPFPPCATRVLTIEHLDAGAKIRLAADFKLSGSRHHRHLWHCIEFIEYDAPDSDFGHQERVTIGFTSIRAAIAATQQLFRYNRWYADCKFGYGLDPCAVTLTAAHFLRKPIAGNQFDLSALVAIPDESDLVAPSIGSVIEISPTAKAASPRLIGGPVLGSLPNNSFSWADEVEEEMDSRMVMEGMYGRGSKGYDFGARVAAAAAAGGVAEERDLSSAIGFVGCGGDEGFVLGRPRDGGEMDPFV